MQRIVGAINAQYLTDVRFESWFRPEHGPNVETTATTATTRLAACVPVVMVLPMFGPLSILVLCVSQHTSAHHKFLVFERTIDLS
jgi:hypothetical protein